MVKATSADLVAILRRFNRATEDDTSRLVNYVSSDHPYQETTLFKFRFAKQNFIVIFDSKANDDPQQIEELVTNANPNIHGEVLANPLDNHKHYAINFKGHDTYLFEVTPSKKRLDLELAGRYPDISRSTIQKYVKLGLVRVNGEVQTTVKFEVDDTADIAISFPEKQDFSASDLPIIYLDDNVIVVNKPVGVLTHSKGELNDEFTVADFFRRYSTYHADTNRPGIVHRLDRDTSGVIIGARNPETAELLVKQFADRKAKKTYLAIVAGHPKAEKATIDLPIGRNPKTPSTFRVDAGGKSALTNYDVLDQTDAYALVQLAPKTGRTHQLRVHMAYIGTPIIGDRVYGVAANRLFLHAYSLEITIPNGQRETFIAPVPKDFTTLFPGIKDDLRHD